MENDEVGTNRTSKKEAKDLLGEWCLWHPKTRKLIQRIIQIGSNEGDLVLDFFMGSATTQAVAHKMSRQYIGIEQMDYIETVSVERLKRLLLVSKVAFQKMSTGKAVVHSFMQN